MTEFKIPLNASNYMSEERKKAFQEALQDGHQVRLKKDQIATPREDQPSRVPTSPSQAPSNPQSDGSVQGPNSTQPLQKLTESIDEGLAHSYSHQNRTLDVHQQYLSQQNEYAKVFLEVLDQQRLLLENENGEPIKDILETLNKSLEGFHAIQEKGLEVHQQFLDQQAAYTEAFVSLLRHQLQSMEGGNGQLPQPRSPQRRTSRPSAGERRMEGLDGRETEIEPPPAEDSPALKDNEIRETAQPREGRIGSREDSVQELAGPESHTPPRSAVPIEELAGTLLDIVGEKTGYPPEMLELEMDMEADLGIDSIKRVEILGALEDAYPDLPQADTNQLAELRTLQEIVDYMKEIASETESIAKSSASSSPVDDPSQGPSAQMETGADKDGDLVGSTVDRAGNGKSGLSVEELSKVLLDIVGEKTGYPPEMLEMEMDMEADLGIDSIKRVEILGAMEDQTGDLPSFETETLAELRTLGEVVQYMSEVKEKGNSQPTEEAVKKKAPDRNIGVSAVKTIPLPPPDQIDLNFPTHRPLLIGDDGTPLTEELVTLMRDQGWTVVLWRYPERLVPQRENISLSVPHQSIQSISDQDIGEGLARVREEHGQIGGFIHLHPPLDQDQTHRDRDLVKSAFLTAKHLKDDLAQPPEEGRSLYITVTQYDGKLGTEKDHAFGDGSGLPGLTKSLRWEWPETFCRAIDLDPDLSSQEKAEAVLREMQDVDKRYVDVGVGPEGRVTLGQEAAQL